MPPCTLLAIAVLVASQATAQDHSQHAMPDTGDGTWRWNWQSSVFLGANIQERKFTDFRQLESQNWFMAQGQRTRGDHTLGLHAMFSLEPFTLRRTGSAQAFQTGETLDGTPLVDYQHPHDLFMALDATYERRLSDRVRLFARMSPVGEATLGPPAFMHRASARGNPTAPLGHHHTDSTHISRSVLALGVTEGSTTFEISTFKGREPDEERLDLDLGVPDSVAVRVGWRSGQWGGQASIARVRDVEPGETGSAIKLTASLDGAALWRQRGLDWSLIYGQTSSDSGATRAVILEGSWALTPASRGYARAELADKEILIDFAAAAAGREIHIVSRVGAVTIGVEREVASRRWGRVALGGDITFHAVPTELRESYGRPLSVHAGLRFRTDR